MEGREGQKEQSSWIGTGVEVELNVDGSGPEAAAGVGVLSQ